MEKDLIEKRVAGIIRELPPTVQLVGAAKMRTVEEVLAGIQGGLSIIGHNYVQEAEAMIPVIGKKVKWHLIGHLQKNKAKKAVNIFDMIETLDSFPLAQMLERHCSDIQKIMPVLVEVNSGKESSKTGIMPEDVDTLIHKVSQLTHIKIKGLMTMGPSSGNPEDARPYFISTRKIFERLSKENMANVEMRYLSMGMTNTYKVAIEEGANIVRIGTKLFGERK